MRPAVTEKLHVAESFAISVHVGFYIQPDTGKEPAFYPEMIVHSLSFTFIYCLLMILHQKTACEMRGSEEILR